MQAAAPSTGASAASGSGSSPLVLKAEKDAFRRYLESTGVVDSLSRVRGEPGLGCAVQSTSSPACRLWPNCMRSTSRGGAVAFFTSGASQAVTVAAATPRTHRT